ncbi:MAG TPA: glycosyltransferase, partial [Anaerolineae bacterium]|nr:glycosyltransferase [Anaerolineae bacterium]
MNRPLRVLFIAQVFPYPLDSGPKIRAYYVLRYLASRHRVTLVAFLTHPRERRYVDHLASFCEAIYPVERPHSLWREEAAMARSLLTGRPFMIERHFDAEMARLVESLAAEGRYDLIHVDQVKVAQYALGIEGIPRVIDKHNAYALVLKGVAGVDPSPLRRLVARFDWRRMARYEGMLCRIFDGVVAVTDTDRDALLRFSGDNRPIPVIPIAIDCEAIRPVHRRAGGRDILILGSLFYPPNVDGAVWFAREIFPWVRAEVPDARLLLVGGRPAPGVVALGRENGVAVTGYVEDLQPYLEQTAVMAVPLRFGSGMRVKILNGLTWGLPMVSTSVGCEGIGVTPERDILLADTPEAFAHQVVRVLRDRRLADALSANGRRLAEQRYDWRVLYPRWDEVYAHALGSGDWTQHRKDTGKTVENSTSSPVPHQDGFGGLCSGRRRGTAALCPYKLR